MTPGEEMSLADAEAELASAQGEEMSLADAEAELAGAQGGEPISIPDAYVPGATQMAPQASNPVADLTQATANDAVRAVQALPVKADQFGMPDTGQSRVTPNQVEAVTGGKWAAAFKRAAQRRVGFNAQAEEKLGFRDPGGAMLDMATGLKEEVLDKEIIVPAQAKALGMYNIGAKVMAEAGALSPSAERVQRGLGRLVLGDQAQAQMDPLRQREATRATEDFVKSLNPGRLAFGASVSPEDVASAAETALTSEASMLPTYMIGLTGASAAKVMQRFGAVGGAAAVGAIEGGLGEAVTPGGNIAAGIGGGAVLGGALGKVAKMLTTSSAPQAVATIPRENIDAAATDLFNNTPAGEKVAKFSGVVTDIDETGELVAKVLGEDAAGNFVAKTVPLDEGLAIAERHKVAAISTQRLRDSLPENIKRVRELTAPKTIAEKAADIEKAMGLGNVEDEFVRLYNLKYDGPRGAILDPDGITVLADANGTVKLKPDADPAARRAVIRLDGLVEAQVGGKKVVGKPLALGDGQVRVTPLDGSPDITVPETDLTRGVMGSDEWGGGFSDAELNRLFKGQEVGKGLSPAAPPPPSPALGAGRGAGGLPPGPPPPLAPPAAPPPPPAPVPPPTPNQVPPGLSKQLTFWKRMSNMGKEQFDAFTKAWVFPKGLGFKEDISRVATMMLASRTINDETVRLNKQFGKLLGREVTEAEVKAYSTAVSDYMNGYKSWDDLAKTHPEIHAGVNVWVRGLTDEMQKKSERLAELGALVEGKFDPAVIEELLYAGQRMYLKHYLPNGEYAKLRKADTAWWSKTVKEVEQKLVPPELRGTLEGKVRAEEILNEMVGTPGFDKSATLDLIKPKASQTVIRELRDLKPEVDQLRAKYKDDIQALMWMDPLVKARITKGADIKPVAQKLIAEWTKKLADWERQALKAIKGKADMSPEGMAAAKAEMDKWLADNASKVLPSAQVIKDVRAIAEGNELTHWARQVLGEVEDGGLRLAATIAKQRAKIAQLEMFDSLRGTGAFTNDVARVEAEGVEKWHRVTEEDRARVGGTLQGGFVQQDVWDDVVMPVTEAMDESTKLAQSLFSGFRAGVTIGNIPSYFNNAMGNVGGIMMGGANPFRRDGTIREAFEQWNQFRKNPSGIPGLGDPAKMPEALRRHQLFERARQYGLTSSSLGKNELSVQQNEIFNAIKKQLDSNPNTSFADLFKVANQYRVKGQNFLAAAYSAIDPMAKHFTWLDNLAQAGMNIKMQSAVDRVKAQKYFAGTVNITPYSDVQLERLIMDEAARRVMKSFPMFDRLPKMQARLGKALPLVDAFASTQMQLMAIAAQVPGRLMTEPGFRKSMLRYGALMGGVVGGMQTLARINGADPEEVERQQAMLPEGDRVRHFGYQPTPIRLDNGQYVFVDPVTPAVFPLAWFAPGGDTAEAGIATRTMFRGFDSVFGGVMQPAITGVGQALGVGDPDYARFDNPDVEGWQWIAGEIGRGTGITPSAISAVPRAFQNADARGQGIGYGAARALLGGAVSSPNPNAMPPEEARARKGERLMREADKRESRGTTGVFQQSADDIRSRATKLFGGN